MMNEDIFCFRSFLAIYVTFRHETAICFHANLETGDRILKLLIACHDCKTYHKHNVKLLTQQIHHHGSEVKLRSSTITGNRLAKITLFCNRLNKLESIASNLFHVCYAYSIKLYIKSSRIMIYPPWLGKFLDFRINDRLKTHLSNNI